MLTALEGVFTLLEQTSSELATSQGMAVPVYAMGEVVIDIGPLLHRANLSTSVLAQAANRASHAQCRACPAETLGIPAPRCCRATLEGAGSLRLVGY